MNKITFELIDDENGTYVKKTDSNGIVWSVPINEGNSDYQAYLRWLENPEAEENGTIS